MQKKVIKLAFIIQCHKYTHALKYTVEKIIKSENCIIIIHVDKKSDMNNFSSLLSDKVVFVSERVNVSWGDRSQIDATLILLKELSNYQYDYVSFISGEDILVKSIEYLKEYLNKNYSTEFIGLQCDNGFYFKPDERLMYDYPAWYLQRVSKPRLWIKLKTLLFDRLMKKVFYKKDGFNKLPPLYKGSSWFTLSNSAIEYILNYLENNENYLTLFANSYCGDEVFFQTILMNSEFKRKIHKPKLLNADEGSLRYIDWVSGPEYPKVLTISDFKHIKSSGCFFARKIDNNITIENIEKEFS